MQHRQTNLRPDYDWLLTLPQWQAKRKEIICRDGKQCRSCGCTNSLQVHHRQYHKLKATGKYKDPWAYDNSQLITLCNECHKAGHHYYTIPVFIVNH